MASVTKTTVSNTVTTYNIVDAEGDSVLITLTQTFGGGRTLTFVSTGGLHQDGQQLMETYMQMLSTGLTP